MYLFKADVPADGSRLVLRSKCENNEANNRERFIFTWLPSKNLSFVPSSVQIFKISFHEISSNWLAFKITLARTKGYSETSLFAEVMIFNFFFL